MEIESVRSQFPITKTIIPSSNGKKERKLIYFDHGASTHAPQVVMDAYLSVIRDSYANVHRAEHYLSQISSKMIEQCPIKIARLVGISNLENSGMSVFLTGNGTNSLDLASHIFSQKSGDYAVTTLEHHSNDLPHRSRGKVHHIKAHETGILDYEHLESVLEKQEIKLVAITAGSNVTGYMPDVHRVARLAHNSGAKILVDATQRLAHKEIMLKPIGHPEHLDFLAGAGHKMYAPFGASFLIGNEEESNQVPPYLPGGGTVQYVSKEEVVYHTGNQRHEAGTPNVAGSIALGRAADFLMDYGLQHIREHEEELIVYTLKRMKEIENLNLLGEIPVQKKIGVFTFNLSNMYHADVSKELDAREGIATRNGCFCAHPYLIQLLKVSQEELIRFKHQVIDGKEGTTPGAVRATLGIYNTKEEVDTFIETLTSISKIR